MRKKGQLEPIVTLYSFLWFIVTLMVFGLLGSLATLCTGPEAIEIAGTSIVKATFGYQANSFLRTPIDFSRAVNKGGAEEEWVKELWGAEITMADAIIYAFENDDGPRTVVNTARLLDVYAPIAYYSSRILRNAYGSICASVTLELRNENGAVEKTRLLGSCPLADTSDETIIPFGTTKKTISVKLMVGGKASVSYRLCDKGEDFSNKYRYYCHESTGGDACGFLFWGDSELAKYDSNRLCERNLKRVQEGKEIEKFTWSLCRSGKTYKCYDFSDYWFGYCGKGVSLSKYTTEEECMSALPK